MAGRGEFAGTDEKHRHESLASAGCTDETAVGARSLANEMDVGVQVPVTDGRSSTAQIKRSASPSVPEGKGNCGDGVKRARPPESTNSLASAVMTERKKRKSTNDIFSSLLSPSREAQWQSGTSARSSAADDIFAALLPTKTRKDTVSLKKKKKRKEKKL